jgi:hypothetical protein
MEDIEQGTNRTTGEYSIEYEMLVNKLSAAGTPKLKQHHYLPDLNKTVHKVAVSTLQVNEPLKHLIRRCCEIARNVEFRKSLE